MPRIDDIRQRTWDFGLTVLTVILLGSLGLQSFIGTLWVWYSETAVSGWEQGPGYAGYVSWMNLLAAPQVVVLVVVMGLCVPKRLFSRTGLLAVSVAMLFAGVVTGLLTKDLGSALTVYLALAAVIQVAVVALTVAGVRGPSYLTNGRLTKTGSGLLHLGFILFAIVVVSLQHSSQVLPVFTASAVLVTAGTVLAFYADRIAWHRDESPELEAPFDAEDGNGADDAPESAEEIS